jgi:cell division protein FtsZ
MDHVHRQSEAAHIIMGTSVDEESVDQVTVTLVASGGGDLDVGVEEELENAPESGFEADDEPSPLPEPSAGGRTTRRFETESASVTPDKARELYQKRGQALPRTGKASDRMRQGQLPLEIISKGRFEKSEPTLHRGEDLDVPTYIRRGVALN